MNKLKSFTAPHRSVNGASLGVAVVLALAAPAASAQMYHLYLDCRGTVSAGGAPMKRSVETLIGEKDEEMGRQTAGDRSDDRSDANSRARSGAGTKVIKSGDAHLSLALRDNNMTALVQRSNVLPVGERMKYFATNSHYAASYEPQRSGRVFADWRGTWMFSWYPPFQKLEATRFSIDRQTGELEGEMVGPGGEILGRMDMHCEPRKDGEGPAPRF